MSYSPWVRDDKEHLLNHWYEDSPEIKEASGTIKQSPNIFSFFIGKEVLMWAISLCLFSFSAGKSNSSTCHRSMRQRLFSLSRDYKTGMVSENFSLGWVCRKPSSLFLCSRSRCLTRFLSRQKRTTRWMSKYPLGQSRHQTVLVLHLQCWSKNKSRTESKSRSKNKSLNLTIETRSSCLKSGWWMHLMTRMSSSWQLRWRKWDGAVVNVRGKGCFALRHLFISFCYSHSRAYVSTPSLEATKMASKCHFSIEENISTQGLL